MESKKAVIINCLYYGILIIIVLLVFLFLYKYCLLILLSYLTSLVFQPFIEKIIHFMHIQHKQGQTIMSVILVLCIYAILILFVILVLYILLHVFHFLPDYLTKIYQMLLHDHYLMAISQKLYQSLKTIIDTMFSKILHLFFQILLHLTTIIGYMFFHLILTILFVLDDHIDNFFNCHFPYHFNLFISSIKQTVYTILKTYFLLFIVTLFCLYIGFLIIHLQHAFMIAFLIALFDFFPVLGIDMIMIPWIVICIIVNQMKLAISLLIIYMICSIIRNILEPQLMSKQVKIPALYFFITTLIMMKIMGMMGIILTPFLLIVFSQLHDYQKIKNHLKSVDIHI